MKIVGEISVKTNEKVSYDTYEIQDCNYKVLDLDFDFSSLDLENKEDLKFLYDEFFDSFFICDFKTPFPFFNEYFLERISKMKIDDSIQVDDSVFDYNFYEFFFVERRDPQEDFYDPDFMTPYFAIKK